MAPQRRLGPLPFAHVEDPPHAFHRLTERLAAGRAGRDTDPRVAVNAFDLAVARAASDVDAAVVNPEPHRGMDRLAAAAVASQQTVLVGAKRLGAPRLGFRVGRKRSPWVTDAAVEAILESANRAQGAVTASAGACAAASASATIPRLRRAFDSARTYARPAASMMSVDTP